AARVLLKFIADDGPTHAIVIAWNTLFAIFPIALALAATAGLVLNHLGLSAYSVITLVVAILPNDLNAQRDALAAVDVIERRSGLLAIVALAGFLWAASNLFAAIESAFDRAFECPSPGVIWRELLSLPLLPLLRR